MHGEVGLESELGKGSEFIFILPDTDINGVLQYTERLHAKVRKAFIEVGDESVKFTISIGIALSSDKQSSYEIDTLITNADQALYDAKVTGRNKSVIYEDKKLFQRKAVGAEHGYT